MFDIEAANIFAKMLARENITLVTQETSTAFFNLRDRVLTLPDWKGLNIDVQKMLIAHEVAHAIYTPMDAWQAAVKNIDKKDRQKFKTFINILEDCRIDKLILRKYPGIKINYIRAQRYLIDTNFFRMNEVNFKHMSFMRKVNTFYKTNFINNPLNITFDAEEQKIQKRINTLETWEDVITLAEELFEKYKDDEDDVDSHDTINEGGEGDQKEKESSEGEDEECEGGDGELPDMRATLHEDDFDDEDEDGDAGEEREVNKDNQITSPGVRTYDDMNKLLGSSSISQKNNAKVNIAVSYSRTGDFLTINFPVNGDDGLTSSWLVRERPTNMVLKVQQENRAFINLFCSSFIRKRKAKAISKTSESKIGMLNTNRLYEYAINDDIFLRNNIEENQQNHGFVFLIDCSGSMNSIFTYVGQQVYVFYEICRKLQIPFRAYGFSDHYSPAKRNSNFGNTGCSLIPFVDGNRPHRQNLWSLESVIRSDVELSGTPLAKSIILTHPILKLMKEQTLVDIMNLVVLTDGGDGTGQFYSTLIDSKTRAMAKNELSTRGSWDNTSGLYKMLKFTLGARVTTIDITSAVPHSNNINKKNIDEFQNKGYTSIKNLGGANRSFFLSPSVFKRNDRGLVELFVESFA